MRYTFYITIVTKLLSVKVSINSKNFDDDGDDDDDDDHNLEDGNN